LRERERKKTQKQLGRLLANTEGFGWSEVPKEGGRGIGRPSIQPRFWGGVLGKSSKNGRKGKRIRLRSTPFR